MNASPAGILYLVSTPIGNEGDMTARAADVLRRVKRVAYEERKEGERLLRRLGVQAATESLNEHNEEDATASLIDALTRGEDVALVSDAGTPVFSDPGSLLVRRAIERKIRIVPVPGASSLLPALIVSGFPLDRFLYYGWLSPKREQRRVEIRRLRDVPETFVILDTPYRLVPLLQDLSAVLGRSRRVCLAYNLTLPEEEIFHGTAGDLAALCASRGLKGEFVLVVEGRGGREFPASGGCSNR